MAHNISAVTVGAVKHLRDHRGSLSYGLFYSAQTPVKNSRSTDLKHLPPAMAVGLTDHVWTLREVLLFRVPPWPQPQAL